MKKCFFLYVGLILSVFAAMAEEWTDEQVKEALVFSSMVEDDFDVMDRDFSDATNHCSDANRLARLMCEVATNGTIRAAHNMLNRLRTYGTRAQLPFLHSVITNASYGGYAAQAIVGIEGVTTSGVEFVRDYLSPTNQQYSAIPLAGQWRFDVGLRFLDEIGKAGTGCICRPAALGIVREYMARENFFHEWMDQRMQSVDSTYSLSKRRLAVLRAVHARNTKRYDYEYVTNAISTLVAYPETSLPE